MALSTKVASLSTSDFAVEVNSRPESVVTRVTVFGELGISAINRVCHTVITNQRMSLVRSRANGIPMVKIGSPDAGRQIGELSAWTRHSGGRAGRRIGTRIHALSSSPDRGRQLIDDVDGIISFERFVVGEAGRHRVDGRQLAGRRLVDDIERQDFAVRRSNKRSRLARDFFERLPGRGAAPRSVTWHFASFRRRRGRRWRLPSPSTSMRRATCHLRKRCTV